MQQLKTYQTMAQAVEDLKRRGFTANLEWQKDSFKDAETGRRFRPRPEQLTIREYHRFEGASNPDDMAVLYAIEAHDGTRGTISDAFGPYANPDLGAFLKQVRISEKR